MPQGYNIVGVVGDYFRLMFGSTLEALKTCYSQSFIEGLGTATPVEFYITVPAVCLRSFPHRKHQNSEVYVEYF